MVRSMYEELSRERKELQKAGECPQFFTTAGWQLFKEKYLYQADTPRQQYQRIARTLAKHARSTPPNFPYNSWEEAFLDLLMRGWLSASTPVLANTGTSRGMPVSCSGNVVLDNIQEIYKAKLEVATLTKYGFGTASDLSLISPRGTISAKGVKCSGVVPIVQGFVHDMNYISQGSNRRGSWAAYLPITHGDFYELASYLESAPDSLNVGWIITNEFINRLDNRDPEAIRRYQEALKVKMTVGKGYFFFIDKANAKRPEWYVKHNLDIKASQLCTEIMLFSDKDHTYSCVLSSMNVSLYDEWKDTQAPFIATVFLDCVVSEFLEQAQGIPELDKIIRFTEKSRALGLGICGLHTLFQKRCLAFESMEAHLLNQAIVKQIRQQAEQATQWMASEWGEPEWCKGFNRRNTHLLAIAPTKSTALIMGGISEGINPDPAMVYTQQTPAGEVQRINPILLGIMKERGRYNQKTINRILENFGSVQQEEWLSDKEKTAFKNAFEIDQKAIIRMASARQTYVDQGQSLNLFFSAEESEEYISQVHKLAFKDPNILSLYYCYSRAGVLASKGECSVCQ